MLPRATIFFGQILKYSTSSVVDPSLRKRSVTKFTPFR